MVQEIVRKNARGRDETVGQKIFIGEKEVRLRFTMPMWFKMEDEICLMDVLYDMMHSKGRFGRGKMPALAELMSGGEITQDDVLKEEDPKDKRLLHLVRFYDHYMDCTIDILKERFNSLEIHGAQVFETLRKSNLHMAEVSADLEYLKKNSPGENREEKA